MADIERLTITLPAEMAVALEAPSKPAIMPRRAKSFAPRSATGKKLKRALQLQELGALKSDIDAGLADLAAGRVQTFDTCRIVERGRKLLNDRSSSA